jgi:Domain of unknown function (DUF4345)
MAAHDHTSVHEERGDLATPWLPMLTPRPVACRPSGMRRRSRKSVLALQVAIGVFGLVPVAAGVAGAVMGPALVGDDKASISADSHYRYLSGLLLAVGLLFWSTIPRIERQAGRVRLLTAIVVVGGLARLGGLIAVGEPSAAMLFGLMMELVVTPLLCLWQGHVAVGRLG